MRLNASLLARIGLCLIASVFAFVVTTIVALATVGTPPAINRPATQLARAANAQVTIFLHQYPRTIYAITGHDTSFSVALSNTGDITLSNAFVQAQQAPDCNRTFPVLPPKSGIWYTCTAFNVQKSFNSYSFSRAWPPTGTYAADSDNAPIIVIAPTISPSIRINQDLGRVMVLYGANPHFWMSIANPSPITLTDIVVSNPTVPQCDGYSLPQLAPFAIAYYYCEPPAPSASFWSTATVMAHPFGDTSTISNTSVAHVVMANYVLLTGYNVNTDTVHPGDHVQFDENATNVTAVTGTNVMMTATLPPGTSFVSVQGGTYSSTLQDVGAPGVYWQGDVTGNTSHIMTLTVRVDLVTGVFSSLGRVSTNGEEITYDQLDVQVITPYSTFVPFILR